MTIDALGSYGVTGSRKEGLAGEWVGSAKVPAMGIKLRRWVTMHGVALNVRPGMRYFDNIVPCDIDDGALSVGALRDWVPGADLAHVAPRFRDAFADHFCVQVDELCGDAALNFLMALPVAAT